MAIKTKHTAIAAESSRFCILNRLARVNPLSPVKSHRHFVKVRQILSGGNRYDPPMR
jgi:hypothetical protein